jgi:hypothetical protein
MALRAHFTDGTMTDPINADILRRNVNDVDIIDMFDSTTDQVLVYLVKDRVNYIQTV